VGCGLWTGDSKPLPCEWAHLYRRNDGAQHSTEHGAHQSNVTADGSRFLISASRTTSTEMAGGTRPRVVVVQNWVEEFKARVPVP
jgi:hypothetical protein